MRSRHVVKAFGQCMLSKYAVKAVAVGVCCTLAVAARRQGMGEGDWAEAYSHVMLARRVVVACMIDVV